MPVSLAARNHRLESGQRRLATGQSTSIRLPDGRHPPSCKPVGNERF